MSVWVNDCIPKNLNIEKLIRSNKCYLSTNSENLREKNLSMTFFFTSVLAFISHYETTSVKNENVFNSEFMMSLECRFVADMLSEVYTRLKGIVLDVPVGGVDSKNQKQKFRNVGIFFYSLVNAGDKAVKVAIQTNSVGQLLITFCLSAIKLKFIDVLFSKIEKLKIVNPVTISYLMLFIIQAFKTVSSAFSIGGMYLGVTIAYFIGMYLGIKCILSKNATVTIKNVVSANSNSKLFKVGVGRIALSMSSIGLLVNVILKRFVMLEATRLVLTIIIATVFSMIQSNKLFKGYQEKLAGDNYIIDNNDELRKVNIRIIGITLFTVGVCASIIALNLPIISAPLVFSTLMVAGNISSIHEVLEVYSEDLKNMIKRPMGVSRDLIKKMGNVFYDSKNIEFSICGFEITVI